MVDIHPLVSPWGRFGLYSYFIDAAEPAIVDTGIASSPAEGMAPALQALGRRIEDVRWILLTHGHIDHIGGAHALWEMTGRSAQVVIHEADAPFLRSRASHADEYAAGRGCYLHDPEGIAKQHAAADAVVSGELEPTVLLHGGERLSLGRDSDGAEVTVAVHHIPGHTPGAVAYEVDGAVFVGDAVQIQGAANGFPGYADPDAYRASLEHLRDVVRPRRLYLGHPYRTRDGEAFGVELDQTQTDRAIHQSLEIEADVRAAAQRNLASDAATAESPTEDSASVYAPFASVAADLGYTGDPTLEPSPFFTTLHGYAALADE